MGESDLQMIVNADEPKSELLEADVKEPGKILFEYAESLLKSGHIHKALNAYISMYKSCCVQAECLELFVECLVQKARVRFAEDPFMCSICSDVMTDPVTLKCGHTFSKKCVLASTKKEVFVCKKCDKKYSVVQLAQLKTNVTISALIEKLWKSSTSMQSNCENKCQSTTENEGTSMQSNSEIKCQSTAELTLRDLKKVITTAFANDSSTQRGMNETKSAIIRHSIYPKAYFQKGELLVSLRKYEEAFSAYLICFTFDSKAIQAKEKATILLHNLMKYHSERNHCKTDVHALSSVPFTHTKTLNGSNGSLNSASSNDSSVTTIDDSSSSEDEETKNWNQRHGDSFTVQNNLHQVVDVYYSDVKKISGKSMWIEKSQASCVDKRDFECPLCMRILWEPVSTPCGHTFCRMCLNRCFDHQPTCPLCKTSLANFLAERILNTTELLQLAMQTILLDDYLERKSIHEEEMEELSNAGKDPEHVIPLFVCTIAYPTVPCPLHVFEPRYRLMIRQCMESGSRRFGMCAYIDNRIADYGTMLEIIDVQYFPDGRSVVGTVGSKRFHILRKGERDGYDTGAVEFLQDEALIDIHAEDMTEKHDLVYKLSQAWFTHIPYETQQRILQHFGPLPSVETNYLTSPNGPSWFWWMLAILPLEPRSQLRILAMTSLHHRLDTLHGILVHLESSNII